MKIRNPQSTIRNSNSDFIAANRLLGRVWLTIACLFAIGAILPPHNSELDLLPVMAAIMFTFGALHYFNIGRSTLGVRRLLSGKCLSLSAWLLRAAARVAPKPFNPQPSTINFSIATLHPSPPISDLCPLTSDLEPPVTISQLLSILDRSTQHRLMLEIPGYRITADRITPSERFIVANAGRDGFTPDLVPWTRASHHGHKGHNG